MQLYQHLLKMTGQVFGQHKKLTAGVFSFPRCDSDRPAAAGRDGWPTDHAAPARPTTVVRGVSTVAFQRGL